MKHRTREFVWSTGLLGALLVPMFEGRAHAQPTRFEAPADLFYLHPLVNYQLPLSWRARWERERLSTNGVQANVGSISTKDFTTHVRVDIDEAANEHLRLLYHLDWLDTPHLDGAERQDWIGFELGGWHTRWGVWGAQLVAHPASDKADLDLIGGLVWTDSSRERYLRIGRRSDDFLFAEKSRSGAVVDQTARGPTWTAHGHWGQWSVSSEGTILRRQERRFPSADLSPDLSQASLRREWSSSALRRSLGEQLIELRLEHREFAESALDRAGTATRRASRLRVLSLGYERHLGAEWRLRAQVHRMHYDDSVDEADHRRRENLAGVFVERVLGSGHAIDIGYMATGFEWNTHPADDRYGRDRNGTASKWGLGWTYALGDRGWYRFSLSHEPDPQRFGGASMQAQMNF